jgi:hypothetical protein
MKPNYVGRTMIDRLVLELTDNLTLRAQFPSEVISVGSGCDKLTMFKAMTKTVPIGTLNCAFYEAGRVGGDSSIAMPTGLSQLLRAKECVELLRIERRSLFH